MTGDGLFLPYGGMQVQVLPDPLRYQLPADLPLPPGFREEFNDWARRSLGNGPSLLMDGEVWWDRAARTFTCNPRTYEQIHQTIPFAA